MQLSALNQSPASRKHAIVVEIGNTIGVKNQKLNMRERFAVDDAKENRRFFQTGELIWIGVV